MMSARKDPVSTIRQWSLILAALLLLSSCSSRETIKVGFIGILTGDFSEIGISTRNAVMMAIDEVNEAGGIKGRQIELLIRDDKGDAMQSLALARELMEEDVVAIFGPTISTVALQYEELFTSEDAPVFLTTTVSAVSLDGIDDNHIKFVSVSTRKDKITELLLDKNGVTEIVIVDDLTNEDFAREYVSDFSPLYQSRGGRIIDIIDYHAEGESSYEAIAERIIAKGPRGIIFMGDNRNTALLCQQLLKKEYNCFRFTYSMTDTLIRHGGKSVEGLMMLNTFDPHSRNPEYRLMAQNYESRYNMTSNFAVQRSYEAAGVLIDALKRDPKAKDLKQTILEKGLYPGLQGDIRIDENGDVEREMYIFTIRDGQIVSLEEKL